MRLPLGEKGAEIATEDQDGPSRADDRKTAFDPMPHRVAVNTEKARSFCDGVTAVGFGAARVDASHYADRPSSDVERRRRSANQASRSAVSYATRRPSL